MNTDSTQFKLDDTTLINKWAKYYKSIYVLLILAFVVGLIYSNTLNSPFVLDDNRAIPQNEYVKNIDKLLTYDYFFSKQDWEYRPLSYLTFAINYMISGENVASYHATNILIHIITSFVIFLLFRLILGLPHVKILPNANQQFAFAFLGAVFFAVHPIQTNVATYIVQRMASLSTMFYLLTIYFYSKGRLRQIESGFSSKVLLLLALALLTTLFAIWSKLIAVTLPLNIALFEAFFIRDKQGKTNKKLIYITVSVFISAVAIVWVTGNLPTGDIGSASRIDYLMTQFRVIPNYLQLLVMPFGLNLWHDIRPSVSFGIYEALGLLLIIGILFIGFKYLKRNPLVSFGIFFFFNALSSESSIMPILDAMFEHRTYLPMFGFVCAFVFIAKDIISTFNNRYVITSLLMLSIVFGALTYARNEVWKTKISLWEDTVSKSPNHYESILNLGIALCEDGKRIKEARLLLEKVITIDSNDYRGYGYLGNALMSLKEYEKALWAYKTCVRLDPQSYSQVASSIEFCSRFVSVVNRKDDGYQKNIESEPDNEESYHAYGMYLQNNGRLNEALEQYRKAFALNPKHRYASSNIGEVLIL